MKYLVSSVFIVECYRVQGFWPFAKRRKMFISYRHKNYGNKRKRITKQAYLLFKSLNEIHS